jgi:hypothetical protein
MLPSFALNRYLFEKFLHLPDCVAEAFPATTQAIYLPYLELTASKLASKPQSSLVKQS